MFYNYVDTQLYVAMSPTSYSNDVNSLQQCLAFLHTWYFYWQDVRSAYLLVLFLLTG